jgi:topoisomerase-4 subunit A
VPIGAGGLRAAGVYRNKHTEDILAGDALAPYIGKRARKGRALDVRPKQPVVLSPVLG